jgi:Chlorophyllase enzyme
MLDRAAAKVCAKQRAPRGAVRTRHSAWLLGSLWLFGSAACSDANDTSPILDGSIRLGDAMSPSVVPGTTSDAGTAPTSDAGTASTLDAAQARDSAVVATDGATTAPMDSAVPASDAGTDAAPVIDASADTGSQQPPDAGQPDTGSQQPPDAGQPDAGGGPVDYTKKGPYSVVVQKNVGNAFRNNVGDDTATCNLFIGLLGGSNPDVDKELTTYPADMERGLYTLFRPEPLEPGKTYPVLTWGNGTCSHPLLFDELINHVVSHGFIVIASNSRWVGDGNGTVMLRGIDFMLSENANKESALYGKIDTKMIGAFGHSQGSMTTAKVGADKRIVATVPIMGASAADARILNGPTFLIAGEKDTIVTPAGIRDAYSAATVPAVYGLSMGQDHLMPGVKPEFIWDAVTAWFKIHLAGDQQARGMFYGDQCTLCKDPRWQVQRKNL